MRRPAIFLVVALVGGAVLTVGTPAAQDRPRIVAVGDVHGAVGAFTAILARAGLIDDQQRWIGGRAILVQTGDVTDRGSGTRDALDLLMALESQAAKAGGRVHAVLGNHEVMNLTGNMRDATPEIAASFGGEPAMRQAFGAAGRYGRWLRQKPAVLALDETIFMHAGISPEESVASLKDINARVRRDIGRWDDGVAWLVKRKLVSPAPAFLEAVAAARAEIERLNALAEAGEAPLDGARAAAALLPVANVGESSLFTEHGPLWFRGYDAWSNADGAPRIEALVKRYGVTRIVSGHSVQPAGRITARFDGRLFLIDTGMLGAPHFPGGAPSALVLAGAMPQPIYLQ